MTLLLSGSHPLDPVFIRGLPTKHCQPPQKGFRQTNTQIKLLKYGSAASIASDQVNGDEKGCKCMFSITLTHSMPTF